MIWSGSFKSTYQLHEEIVLNRPEVAKHELTGGETLRLTSYCDTTADPHAPAGPASANDHGLGKHSTRSVAAGWSPSRWFWVAAVGIILVALFLRLWRLDLVQFKDDQPEALRLAEDTLRLGRALAGMTSSIGIPLAPSFEYFLAPIVAVSRDPRVATGHRTGQRRGRGGHVSVGLAVGFARGRPGGRARVRHQSVGRLLRAQGVEPGRAFADGGVADVLPGQGRHRWAGWLGHLPRFPVFALGVEFHPSFGLLAPFLVVLGVLQVRRGQAKHLAIGLALAALTAVPYLSYMLQTRARDVSGLASSGPLPIQIDGAGHGNVVGLIGGWHNCNVEPLDITPLLPWRLAAVSGAIETLLLALGIAAALMLVFRSRQVEQRVRARGLLPWVLVPMFLTIWHPIPLYDYYYLFVLPAGALLIGLGIHLLSELGVSQRAGRLLVGAALAAPSSWQGCRASWWCDTWNI